VTQYSFDYTWNDWYYNTTYGWQGVSTGRVTQSGTCIAVGDGWSQCYGDDVSAFKYPAAPLGHGLTESPAYWPDGTYWEAAGNNSALGCFSCWEARHDGLVNFGFLDGHAKAMSLNAVSTPVSGYYPNLVAAYTMGG
jgi:prepilin-type processing-associated H-X9-DG protein